MAKKFRVNKQRCIGCGTCVQVCPGATKIGEDMKASVIDNKKLEECGGAKICPFGAIEEIVEDEEEEEDEKNREKKQDV